MANYKYRGRMPDGAIVAGDLAADSEKDALYKLKQQQIYPTHLALEQIKTNDIKIEFFKTKVKARELSIFCKQFATLLAAGVSVIESLDILTKQTEHKVLRETVDSVYNEVQKGIPLSAAMQSQSSVFPVLLINMVETGELSGQLDMILLRMAKHYEKEFKIQKKISGALSYPMFVVGVAILVIMILVTFVLPTFVTMFEGFGVKLPLLTRMLIGLGNVMRNYWYLIMLGFGVIFYVMKRFLATEGGTYWLDSLKLTLPVFRDINRKVAASRFSRSLSIMLNSGVPVIDAIKSVNSIITNSVIQKALERSLEFVRKGEGIAAPLARENVFPYLLVSMIKIGEDSGSLDAMLDSTADFYDEEVDVAIDKMIKMIEPMIMVVLAVVGGGIVLSIALPMFDMYEYIRY